MNKVNLFHGCVTERSGGSAGLGFRVQALSRAGPHVSDLFESMASQGKLFGWHKRTRPHMQGHFSLCLCHVH